MIYENCIKAGLMRLFDDNVMSYPVKEKIDICINGKIIDSNSCNIGCGVGSGNIAGETSYAGRRHSASVDSGGIP